MVDSVPGVDRPFAVIDGVTDLTVSVFGPDRGALTRSAVGTAELPVRIAVEIESEIELRRSDA
jgi:enamine deaminase RidA (YjgF/YER057c/UK114 family)